MGWAGLSPEENGLGQNHSGPSQIFLGQKPSGPEQKKINNAGPASAWPSDEGRTGRATGGRPLSSVGGPVFQVGRWVQGERGEKILNKKNHFFFSPATSAGRKTKKEQCRSKRHRSVPYFYFIFLIFFCMKRRRFG